MHFREPNGRMGLKLELTALSVLATRQPSGEPGEQAVSHSKLRKTLMFAAFFGWGGSRGTGGHHFPYTCMWHGWAYPPLVLTHTL